MEKPRNQIMSISWYSTLILYYNASAGVSIQRLMENLWTNIQHFIVIGFVSCGQWNALIFDSNAMCVVIGYFAAQSHARMHTTGIGLYKPIPNFALSELVFRA